MRPLAKALPLLLAALGSLLFGGCTEPEPVGLYDPNESQAPTPTVASISPAGGAFAGLDTIIINGTNFAPILANNTVYFNAQPAVLLSTSPTQIILKAPVVTLDSIGVRVSVLGAVSFSSAYRYKLTAGVMTFGGLDTTELATSLGTDAAGNIYTMIKAGVVKFTSAGTRSTYAPTIAGVPLWTSLKMGPGGYLYTARNFRVIYRYSPGGGSTPTVWVSAFPSGTYIADIDFDKDGNVWAGGNSASIFKVDKDKNITAYPYVGNIHSVRVYNDYLYFAVTTDTGEKILRAPITGGTLGTPEVYFDFGAAFPTFVPQAITFSSDGTLYIGTNAQDGLVILSPNKTITTPFSAYQSLFGTGLGFLAWGSTNDLYASTSNGKLLKFTVRGRASATYFGSTL
jgi:hypothetical protein